MDYTPIIPELSKHTLVKILFDCKSRAITANQHLYPSQMMKLFLVKLVEENAVTNQGIKI